MNVKFLALSLLLIGVVSCQSEIGGGEKKQRHEEEQRRQEHGESKHGSGVEKELRKEEEKVDERRKLMQAKDNEEYRRLLVSKSLEFFINNPVTKEERQCFANFKEGESVDFVIDIAPSPTLDKVDKALAQSPVGLFTSFELKSPSRTYFEVIRSFIDIVTIDMKPELTHSILYDNGRRYYIRGRKIEGESLSSNYGGEFNDMARNLKTLWPVATKEIHSKYWSEVKSVVRNNLGLLTKMALWNRNNGLPTVLFGSKRSKPVYTIVISDGSSGARISDLTEDLSRTTVIDIGNHRFVKNLHRREFEQLASVVTLPAPQLLMSMADTCREMACRFCGCKV